MKRSSRALGVVVMGLWVAGTPIGAEEAPVEEVAPTEPAPAEAVPAEPVAPAEPPETPVAPAEQVGPAEIFRSKIAAAASEVLAAGAPVVFGELLFLKPTLDDTTFVINSPTPYSFVGPPSGTRENDDFDFEPAFRIGARHGFAESDREVELSYTRLDAEASETVSGSFLSATRGSPDFTFTFGGNPNEDPPGGGYTGSASAEIEAQYQRIDAHLTQPWHLSDLDLGLQFGFEWADFRVGEDYLYANNGTGLVGGVAAASRTWGIGPEVGLELAYQVCEPWEIPGAFSLRAGSSIGLLLSETHTRASQRGILPFTLRDEETSRVITAIHARVGVGYQVPLAERIAATVGVGYQIDTHLRGLTRVKFVDDVGEGLASTDYYDFDLQGVYATFGVAF